MVRWVGLIVNIMVHTNLITVMATSVGVQSCPSISTSKKRLPIHLYLYLNKGDNRLQWECTCLQDVSSSSCVSPVPTPSSPQVLSELGGGRWRGGGKEIKSRRERGRKELEGGGGMVFAHISLGCTWVCLETHNYRIKGEIGREGKGEEEGEEREG